MNLLDETKMLMRKYNIKANKNLGQNFLIDKQVIIDIVDSAEISKNDVVIEIGPGLGSMTQVLLERAKKVICIELDKKMIKVLSERFIAYNNFELIYGDVLKIDLRSIIEEEKNKEQNAINIKIAANLPYYITTPIIMKLLESKLNIQSITVMIQKEVAERLIEVPGGKNTGAITYTVYYYCEGRKVREVDSSSFIPAPDVTSEVINLYIRNMPPVDVKDEKIFFRIIKCAYMQRRKTLLNALVNAKVFNSKEEGIHILKQMNLSENVRAEELRIQDFANLSNYFIKTI